MVRVRLKRGKCNAGAGLFEKICEVAGCPETARRILQKAHNHLSKEKHCTKAAQGLLRVIAQSASKEHEGVVAENHPHQQADRNGSARSLEESLAAGREEGLSDLTLAIHGVTNLIEEQLGQKRSHEFGHGSEEEQASEILSRALHEEMKRFEGANRDVVLLQKRILECSRRVRPLHTDLACSIMEDVEPLGVDTPLRKRLPTNASITPFQHLSVVPDWQLESWEDKLSHPSDWDFIERTETAVASARHEMWQRAEEKEGNLKNRNGGVHEWHEKRKEEVAAATKLRLEALRSSDVEQYLALLQDAKNQRINHVIRETDKCLRRLAQKLKEARRKRTQETIHQSAMVVQGTQTPIESLLSTTMEWDSLAASFNANLETQPEILVGGQLREYQMQGVSWLVSLHEHGLNGILADEMGLGKTIQVIAFISHLVETSSCGHPFLVAAPASVLSNWHFEFSHWAPSLTVVVYSGSADERCRIHASQIRGKSFHVILTTYEMMMGQKDRARLSKLTWESIIVDEGHRLKNPECKLNAHMKKYNAKGRLVLTGKRS
ncbi:hypothetical protein BSKO_10984 [Bryopsis sp. KO-2023]|nr:hypothetical protein BSKO_10984 [Bryopsis sp. KO-2023]